MDSIKDVDGFTKVSPRLAHRGLVVANKSKVIISNNFEVLELETADHAIYEGKKIGPTTEFSPSPSASQNRKQKKRKLRTSPVSGGILSIGWKDDHTTN
ncbi:hypothetical protein Bca4012_063344 [Brassica carinata]